MTTLQGIHTLSLFIPNNPYYQLKLKSLYGLTYIYGRTDKFYYDGIWDDNGNKIEEIDTQCKHYHALTRLNNFVNQNNLNYVSFISKCDVIKEFRETL